MPKSFHLLYGYLLLINPKHKTLHCVQVRFISLYATILISKKVIGMDIVDKFYHVCELFNDDLYQVSLHIKRSGAKGRPSKILKNISNLLLDRYEDIITNTYNQKGEDERSRINK